MGVRSKRVQNYEYKLDHSNEPWHTWPSRVTHITEPCHTSDWVMAHIWLSHAAHTNVSCHTSGGCQIEASSTLRIQVRLFQSKGPMHDARASFSFLCCYDCWTCWFVREWIRMSHVIYELVMVHMDQSFHIQQMRNASRLRFLPVSLWLLHARAVAMSDLMYDESCHAWRSHVTYSKSAMHAHPFPCCVAMNCCTCCFVRERKWMSHVSHMDVSCHK